MVEVIDRDIDKCFIVANEYIQTIDYSDDAQKFAKENKDDIEKLVDSLKQNLLKILNNIDKNNSKYEKYLTEFINDVNKKINNIDNNKQNTEGVKLCQFIDLMSSLFYTMCLDQQDIIHGENESRLNTLFKLMDKKKEELNKLKKEVDIKKQSNLNQENRKILLNTSIEKKEKDIQELKEVQELVKNMQSSIDDLLKEQQETKKNLYNEKQKFALQENIKKIKTELQKERDEISKRNFINFIKKLEWFKQLKEKLLIINKNVSEEDLISITILFVHTIFKLTPIKSLKLNPTNNINMEYFTTSLNTFCDDLTTKSLSLAKHLDKEKDAPLILFINTMRKNLTSNIFFTNDKDLKNKSYNQIFKSMFVNVLQNFFDVSDRSTQEEILNSFLNLARNNTNVDIQVLINIFYILSLNYYQDSSKRRLGLESLKLAIESKLSTVSLTISGLSSQLLGSKYKQTRIDDIKYIFESMCA